MKTKCVSCGKELDELDFKIKSIFESDKYVCQDCAQKEDENWLKEMESKDNK